GIVDLVGVLAEHLDEAAEREPRDHIVGAAAPPGQAEAAESDRRSEADRELEHAHAACARHQEVAQLVHEDEDREQQHESPQIREDHARPPWPRFAASHSRARARAHASAAITSSRSRSGPPASAFSNASSTAPFAAAIAGNGMPPERNSSTATSLAAFSTAGAA